MKHFLIILFLAFTACSHKGQNINSLNLPGSTPSVRQTAESPQLTNQNTMTTGGENSNGPPTPVPEAPPASSPPPPPAPAPRPIPTPTPLSGSNQPPVVTQVTWEAQDSSGTNLAANRLDISHNPTPLVALPVSATKIIFKVQATDPEGGALQYQLAVGSMQLARNNTGQLDNASFSLSPGSTINFNLNVTDNQNASWTRAVPVQMATSNPGPLPSPGILGVTIDTADSQGNPINSQSIDLQQATIPALNLPVGTSKIVFTITANDPGTPSLKYDLRMGGIPVISDNTNGILESGPLTLSVGTNYVFNLSALDNETAGWSWKRNIPVIVAAAPAPANRPPMIQKIDWSGVNSSNNSPLSGTLDFTHNSNLNLFIPNTISNLQFVVTAPDPDAEDTVVFYSVFKSELSQNRWLGGGGNATFPVDISNLAFGTNPVQVTAKDNHNNVTTRSFSIEITLEIILPNPIPIFPPTTPP